MPAPAPAQVQRPSDLANQLINALLGQCNNDPRAASTLAITFVRDTLEHLILESTRDEDACKALLKSVGESIIAAKRPPKK